MKDGGLHIWPGQAFEGIFDRLLVFVQVSLGDGLMPELADWYQQRSGPGHGHLSLEVQGMFRGGLRSRPEYAGTLCSSKDGMRTEDVFNHHSGGRDTCMFGPSFTVLAAISSFRF